MIASTTTTAPTTIKTTTKITDCKVGESYKDNCYFLMETPRDWPSASKDCTARNSTLVTINDNDTNTFIAINVANKSKAWIGATKPEGEEWQWTNGENVTFEAWANGERKFGKHCASINVAAVGKWKDQNCETKWPYICQQQKLFPGPTITITPKTTTSPFDSTSVNATTTTSTTGPCPILTPFCQKGAIVFGPKCNDYCPNGTICCFEWLNLFDKECCYNDTQCPVPPGPTTTTKTSTTTTTTTTATTTTTPTTTTPTTTTTTTTTTTIITTTTTPTTTTTTITTTTTTATTTIITTTSTTTITPTPTGLVGPWSSWSDCTATCGNGTKTRTRTCQISPCHPFVKEETVNCHLPSCNDPILPITCFYEDTNITFHDLGKNHLNQDTMPVWILSNKGRTINSFLNTRPSVGLSNLGNKSKPVSFSGRVFSTFDDDDVMGMVFGFWNETNFFVVASSEQDGPTNAGPTNWYVGRVHATCGQSCASKTTISNAIWSPHDHPEDITVLATGSTYWQAGKKYNFTICFNPSKLLLNVNVTLDDGVDPILQTGTISAKTNDLEVDAISRQGGFIGVYVDSQANTTWDNLDCYDCDLNEFTGDDGSCDKNNYTLVLTGGDNPQRLNSSEQISFMEVCSSPNIPQLPEAITGGKSVWFEPNTLMFCGGSTTYVGGAAVSGATNKCLKLTPGNNEWENNDAFNMNVDRSWFSLNYINGYGAVAAGGLNNDNTVLNSLERYSDGEWKLIDNIQLDKPTYVHCAVQYTKRDGDSYLMIIGGSNTFGEYDITPSATEINLSTGDKVSVDPGPLPGLWAPACTICGDDIYVSGGGKKNGDNAIQSTDVYKYNIPAGGPFTLQGEMNTPRWGHTMGVTSKGQLVVSGGWEPGYLASIESSEDGGASWKTWAPALSTKQEYAAMASVPAFTFACTD